MEQIHNSIDKNKDKILRFLRSLISFKSINPSKNHIPEILGAMDYVSEFMEDLGGKNVVHETKNGVPILTSLFSSDSHSDSTKKLESKRKEKWK